MDKQLMTDFFQRSLDWNIKPLVSDQIVKKAFLNVLFKIKYVNMHVGAEIFAHIFDKWGSNGK